MAKTIELHFMNSEGKVRSLSVDNPKEPIDPAATKLVWAPLLQQIFLLEPISSVRRKFVLSSIM